MPKIHVTEIEWEFNSITLGEFSFGSEMAFVFLAIIAYSILQMDY